MKNYTKQLNKFILIMTLLFLGSMFYFNPENTTVLTDLQEEKQITEQITDSKFIDDSVNESPTTSSVIDYNTWYLGETVDTTISFAKANYQFDTITISLDSETGQDSYSGFRNYASYTSFQAFNKDNDDETKVYVFFAIDVARVGTTFYKISSSARKVTGWLSGSTHESSFALSSAYIQSDGKAFFQITSQQYYISASQWVHFTLSIAVMNIDGTWVTLASGLTSNTAGGTFTSHHLDGALDIYYFYNQADEITENARMQIKYTSPTTKLGKVDFYNPVFETTVALNLSEIWGYSSITPTATTSFVSNDLTITNTIPSTYSVLFTSNCSNHLAIKDASTDFLTDVGFEGSTDIYTNWASNPFETFETSTEQAFAGYSSLKTIQSAGTYGISYVLLPNDYYYVSCWAYIDSISGGAETVSIAWWNGTAWNYEYFDDTIIDRWQNLQFYMQIIDDDSGRNFQFYVSATTATVYFDYESLLFQTSTTIETTQSSESQIDFDGVVADGYKFTQDSFRDYQVELWDRTAQTLEHSYSVTTDEFGHGTVIHPYAFEQKEYEVRVFTYDNWFGDYAETVLNDRWDFEEDLDGFVPTSDARSSLSQTTDEGEGVLFQNVSGSYDWWWMGIQGIDNGGSITIDADIYTTIIFSFKTATTGDEHEIFVIDDGADGTPNILSSGVIDASNYCYGNGEYIYLQIHLSLMTWSTGDWSGSQTEGFRIRTEREDETVPGADEDEYYKSIKLVSGGFYSKFYFTPSTFSETPTLIETDTSFYLSSTNNTNQYEIYLDSNYLGVYSDLQTILKNNTVGSHNLTYVLFSAGEETAYLSSTYEYLYTVEATAFSVSVENFYLSDLYVSTYVTSNYNGQYYVYKDNTPDGSGTLSAIGTTISTSRDLTVGVTINYAIKFVNDTSTIWFNTTYSNPSQDFFITDYRINTTAPNIIITWDTSKNTIDSLTAIEDDVEKVTDDPTSTTSWTKSTEVGTHYVTLIFSVTNFDDIIYSFTYTVAAIEEFQVDVENVYPSDDYLSIYCTSNYDYSYETYTNGTPSGSGNGLSVGTFIIIPKETTAGIFNLTVAFVYGAETVLFMTWYSNLIPPPEPNTDIYREQSEGFFNISFITNLDHFWIDIYHDSVLIVDDSTLTAFSIAKDTLIGWHNVSLILIYNCTTNSDGYPVAEYNETVTYPLFWYETVLFYDCQIRYTEKIYGIAVPEIDVDSVLTYLNGVLVDTLNYTSVIQEHSNYSYILNNRLWIHNSARNHRLVVRDLFDNLIYNVSIDIGIIQSMTIELPLEKLYVINLDNDDRMIKIRPYLSGLDWDTDADDLITMILGQYESKSYWVIDSTYECRIYKKVESVSDGVTLWYWLHDPNVEPPPERVPFSITIPLVTDDDDDGEKTWWDKVVDFFVQYWFYIALVLLLIVLLISYNAIGNAIVKKLEKTIREGKKPSLFAETFLQLLWSSKYDRLVGYKRGKQK